jgi:phosphonate transport system substrate-binding protein
VGYLAAKLAMTVELVETVGWTERERMLDAGEIDLCWICGLPYAAKADRGDGLGLAVAPVMRGERYGNGPVYFSDVLVRSESRYARFDDLEGEAVAYNEPRSHSGYTVLCYYVALHGRTLDYFGRMVEAGAHQTSLQMIVSGQVAAAAIDTTVLEAEVRADASLARKVRAIETLGPSPSPPWVFARAVPAAIRLEATQCLAEMHADAVGASILEEWGIAEWRRVRDADYDPIREMFRAAVTAHRGRPAIFPG